jgi:hypothetical protein
MGIASEEKFNEYIDAAGQIVVDFMQQQGKPYPLAEARQGAREMGDRYRKHGMNPTVGDLVWGVYLRMGTKPLDAARALDPIVDRIVEAQERLRR